MSKTYDTIIIGAGIAGLTAAIYAARANQSILVLERKLQGGQIVQTLNVENWPGIPSISGPDLANNTYAQAQKLGAKIEYEDVESVQKTGDLFTIKTDEGEYEAKSLIIATGTTPRELPEERVKEANGRPISYCATCDGAFYKDKPVIVIGRGNTAKYEIAYLENIASKVYSVYRTDPFPDDAVAIFVAIGREPNTDIFAGLVERDENGYIVADEDCHTSAPGIFVAGDCRTKPVRQLVTAAGDGAVAATEAIKYLKSVL